MKRRDEINLIQRSLDRLMTLTEDEMNEMPTRDELLEEVEKLKSELAASKRELHLSAINQSRMLWFVIHEAGGVVTITRDTQIEHGDIYGTNRKLTRVDHPNGDVEISASLISDEERKSVLPTKKFESGEVGPDVAPRIDWEAIAPRTPIDDHLARTRNAEPFRAGPPTPRDNNAKPVCPRCGLPGHHVSDCDE